MLRIRAFIQRERLHLIIVAVACLFALFGLLAGSVKFVLDIATVLTLLAVVLGWCVLGFNAVTWVREATKKTS